MRNNVEKLTQLLEAMGYVTSASNEAVTFEDVGALTSSEQRIVAGASHSITWEDIAANRPHYLVVEDGPTEQQRSRLQDICDKVEARPSLLGFSAFIDRLWSADGAARQAQSHSAAAEDTGLPLAMSRPKTDNPNARYESPTLKVGENKDHRGALRFVEEWGLEAQQPLVILADAGLGKSELTRVLQWRFAAMYQNEKSQYSGTTTRALRPIALRVRLRDLRSFDLASITSHLRHSHDLQVLRNAHVLDHLLKYGRIVLLLDGLDELQVEQRELRSGLKELDAAAQAGARILITSRAGFRRSEMPLRTDLTDVSVVHLERLDDDSAEKFLINYGSERARARSLTTALPDPMKGVPLFLLWAYLSGNVGNSELSTAENLLRMIRDFCAREESRIGLEAEEQMEYLREIAYQNFFYDPLEYVDLSYLLGEEDAAFITGPHALLVGGQTVADFRYASFRDLFLAQAIAERWGKVRDDRSSELSAWLHEQLGSVRLEGLTPEFLAQLVDVDTLRHFWRVSAQAPIRYAPWTRRNLLAIALSHINQVTEVAQLAARTELLSSIVEGRELGNADLYGLTFEQFKFDGWDLGKVKATNSFFSFCDFHGADLDGSLQSADIDGSCTGLDQQISEAELLRRGRTTLERALRPWINYAISESNLRRRIHEDSAGVDGRVVQQLRSQGFLRREQAERGSYALVLTDAGREALQRFLEDPPSDTTAPVRDLLLSIGSWA